MTGLFPLPSSPFPAPPPLFPPLPLTGHGAEKTVAVLCHRSRLAQLHAPLHALVTVPAHDPQAAERPHLQRRDNGQAITEHIHTYHGNWLQSCILRLWVIHGPVTVCPPPPPLLFLILLPTLISLPAHNNHKRPRQPAHSPCQSRAGRWNPTPRTR